MKSTSNSILRRIRAKQHGWVFTPKNFIDLAPRNTINITLHRLLKKGIIRKLAHGLYDFPVKHAKLGTLAANPDAIAKAIAARTGDIIQPSSAQLANQLGLDTQVPAKPAYITSGNPTRKKIGNYPITLNHSKFLSKTPLSINAVKVINALHHLGKDNITDNIVKKCQKILSQKDKSQLKKNLNQLPNWMVQFTLKIIGK
jgi:predicted transcriptional regulator of viral defense system